MRRGVISTSLAAAAALAIATFVFQNPAAQTEPDLTKPAGKEWLHVGGDWSNSRYSTLTQLTPANIKNLKGAWVTHLGSGLGAKYSLEVTPIVKDGVMYVTTGNDDVFALDAKTGALIWEHKSGLDQNITTVCCGWDNRGVAIGEGKVFPRPARRHLRRAGCQDRQAPLADAQSANGRTATPSPPRRPITKARSIPACPAATARRAASSPRSTRRPARSCGISGPRRVRARRGGDTWPSPNDPDPDKAHAYLNGGANVWQAPAIDPELGLIYFSTGQPGPDAVGEGSKRPGDNLFSSSILALHLDGTYAWHFQMVHHDLWDFDCPSPVVLFDQVYNGVKRKGIAEACKTGWIYMLDRTNGKPLIGIDEKPVEQDARVASAPTQPIPRGDALIPQCPEAARRLGHQMHLRRDLRHADPDVAGRQWRHELVADGLQPADRIFLRQRRRPSAKPHPAPARQDRRSAHRRALCRHVLGGRFPHQQNRLAEEDALFHRTGQRRSGDRVGACFSTANPAALSRPMTPRMASCSGNGRPAPAPMRPPSPMRSTASNMSPSPRAASPSRPRPPIAT